MNIVKGPREYLALDFGRFLTSSTLVPLPRIHPFYVTVTRKCLIGRILVILNEYRILAAELNVQVGCLSFVFEYVGSQSAYDVYHRRSIRGHQCSHSLLNYSPFTPSVTHCQCRSPHVHPLPDAHLSFTSWSDMSLAQAQDWSGTCIDGHGRPLREVHCVSQQQGLLPLGMSQSEFNSTLFSTYHDRCHSLYSPTLPLPPSMDTHRMCAALYCAMQSSLDTHASFINCFPTASLGPRDSYSHFSGWAPIHHPSKSTPRQRPYSNRHHQNLTDKYVHNTTAHTSSVIASALSIQSLLPFLTVRLLASEKKVVTGPAHW